MERDEQVAEALTWISARLDELGVPFQVAGGLAAIAHGASRPLNDIDIYVPEGSLSRIRAELADHQGHGPERYRDEQWDCYFMEVHYAGEEIELAEAGRTRYRSDSDAPWHEAGVDFGDPARRVAFDVEIPVMPLEQLVEYKRRIGREVDREDVAELTGG